MNNKLKNIKRILTFVLALSMLLSSVVFAAEKAPWDANYSHGGVTIQFMPEEGYISEQNPPAFRWGKIEGCKNYELVVSKDEALKEVVLNKKGIEDNYYVPEVTLDTNAPLYWAVKHTTGGSQSNWSTVRKFYIRPDAVVYTLPDADTLLERVPEGHPRIWLKPEELTEFRGYKDTSEGAKEVYDWVMAKAKKYADENIIEKEPERKTSFATYEEEAQYYHNLNNICLSNLDRAFVCGYAYLISGDEYLGDYAKRAMLEYCNWDYHNGVSCWADNQQPFRSITYRGSMVYDWIYPLLSESERASLVEMLGGRLEYMIPLLESIEKQHWDSMGWTSYGYIGIAAVALYGDLPEAKGYLRQILKGYPALVPSWSYQSGGWPQGLAYSWYSTTFAHEFMEVLARAGIFDMYNTAWQKNAYKWGLYAHPYNSLGSFGDGAGDSTEAAFKSINNLHEIFFMDDAETNAIRKWFVEKSGGLVELDYSNFSLCSYWQVPKYEQIEAKAPDALPLAYEFNDEGWAIMQSDIADPNRVQMTFVSSPFGTYNHSHAHNNGIFIEAYGKPLAVHAGTYDSYMSPHHKNFTHQSHAHNTITVDNQGQPIQDIGAKGQLTAFLHQQEFDLSSGDATKAYAGRLGRFERSIIYVRPDMFVVIDDLKASESRQKSRFQWWLNADEKIEIYDTKDGARVDNDGAMLDAKVQYPSNVNAYYLDIYSGADMAEYPPTVKETDRKAEKRVWFETEKVDETKMIVTLDVHTGASEARYVDTKEYDKYVKMVFTEGTVVLVNKGSNDIPVSTNDGFTFTGKAVAYTDDSIMLVEGTSLKQGDKELISLEKEGSVVMGLNELSISTYSDNKVVIDTNNTFINGVNSITDYYGKDAFGVAYTQSEDKLSLELIADNYQLMLNGKAINAVKETGSVELVIDGVFSTIPLEGYVSRAGEGIYNGKLSLDGAKYYVKEMTDGLVAGTISEGRRINIKEAEITAPSPEGNRIVLEKAPVIPSDHSTATDYDAIKPSLAWFTEAENWSSPATGVRAYTTRSWLSGGKGVQFFDDIGSTMEYEVEVPEDGEYCLVIKYVAWGENGIPTRTFNFDEGVDYGFTVDKTDDHGTKPEIWRAVTIEQPTYLAAGKHTLSLGVTNEGMWNLDWLGLIKK